MAESRAPPLNLDVLIPDGLWTGSQSKVSFLLALPFGFPVIFIKVPKQLRNTTVAAVFLEKNTAPGLG